MNGTGYLSASSAVVSSKEYSELSAADLTHRHTLVGHHDWRFVAKFLHLGTLHHLCTSVWGGGMCESEYMIVRVCVVM